MGQKKKKLISAVKLPYLDIVPNKIGIPYAYVRYIRKRFPIKNEIGEHLTPDEVGFYDAYEKS